MKKLALTLAALAAFAGAAAVVVLSVTGGGSGPLVDVAGGDPARGRELIERYGCGSCHRIPGVDSTDEWIGPPLAGLAGRRFIAGNEPNRPDVLIRWIQDPKSIDPGTAMPRLGVTAREARDIAAYLYDLR